MSCGIAAALRALRPEVPVYGCEVSTATPLTASLAAAVRLLAERNRIIAEGAGATPVAAALADRGGARKVVCIISGGNIDAAKLCTILEGRVP